MRHIFKSKRLAILSISISTLLLLTGISLAANDTPKQVQDNVSQEGYMAMQEAGFARVAIFDGQLEEAQNLIKKAQNHLKMAKKNAPQLAVTAEKDQKSGNDAVNSAEITETDDFIPIDTGLSLAEDFVATPEKTKKIEAANEEMQGGNQAKAHEILKESGINVSVTRLLMPLDFVSAQVDRADNLFKEHKYYEANLALKSVADSLVVDNVVLYEPPQQDKNS